jgi:hypothetical protein
MNVRKSSPAPPSAHRLAAPRSPTKRSRSASRTRRSPPPGSRQPTPDGGPGGARGVDRKAPSPGTQVVVELQPGRARLRPYPRLLVFRQPHRAHQVEVNQYAPALRAWRPSQRPARPAARSNAGPPPRGTRPPRRPSAMRRPERLRHPALPAEPVPASTDLRRPLRGLSGLARGQVPSPPSFRSVTPGPYHRAGGCS